MEPYPGAATAAAPAPQHPRRIGWFSWTLSAVVVIMTGYSGMAAYRLKDDAATAATLMTSFWMTLVLLLCCLLSLKERAAAGSGSRKRLKAFVWALTTLLFFHVAYMAMGAAELTLRGALLLWFVPAAAWAVIFLYALFHHHQDIVYEPPDDEAMFLPTV